MTDQEKQDLLAMKEFILKKKESTYDYMKSFLTLDAERLSHTGYKTVEQALRMSMESAEKTIKGLMAAHIRKYPD